MFANIASGVPEDTIARLCTGSKEQKMQRATKREDNHNDHKPVDNTEEERTYYLWDKEMEQYFIFSFVFLDLQFAQNMY